VYLARPDLNIEDLIKTAETIIKYQLKKTGEITVSKKDEIKNLSRVLSEAYRDFRTKQIVGFYFLFVFNSSATF
jgi:hypothetical protein